MVSAGGLTCSVEGMTDDSVPWVNMCRKCKNRQVLLGPVRTAGTLTLIVTVVRQWREVAQIAREIAWLAACVTTLCQSSEDLRFTSSGEMNKYYACS